MLRFAILQHCSYIWCRTSSVDVRNVKKIVKRANSPVGHHNSSSGSKDIRSEQLDLSQHY